jgi:hypothetical protein
MTDITFSQVQQRALALVTECLDPAQNLAPWDDARELARQLLDEIDPEILVLGLSTLTVAAAVVGSKMPEPTPERIIEKLGEILALDGGMS